MLPLQYELLVDKNARSSAAPTIFHKQTYYGQLLQLLVVNVGVIQTETIRIPPSTLVLAEIHTCQVISTHRSLDIHYYKNLGGKEVVDADTIACVVGRVRDREQWAIIDRSGTLSRAVYVDEA